VWNDFAANFDLLSSIAGFVVGALFVAAIGRARR